MIEKDKIRFLNGNVFYEKYNFHLLIKG